MMFLLYSLPSLTCKSKISSRRKTKSSDRLPTLYYAVIAITRCCFNRTLIWQSSVLNFKTWRTTTKRMFKCVLKPSARQTFSYHQWMMTSYSMTAESWLTKLWTSCKVSSRSHCQSHQTYTKIKVEMYQEETRAGTYQKRKESKKF